VSSPAGFITCPYQKVRRSRQSGCGAEAKNAHRPSEFGRGITKRTRQGGWAFAKFSRLRDDRDACYGEEFHKLVSRQGCSDPSERTASGARKGGRASPQSLVVREHRSGQGRLPGVHTLSMPGDDGFGLHYVGGQESQRAALLAFERPGEQKKTARE
jgi:hypothetical protein